jgi:hypothetical protein
MECAKSKQNVLVMFDCNTWLLLRNQRISSEDATIHDLRAPKEDIEKLWQAWAQPDIWRLPHGNDSWIFTLGLTDPRACPAGTSNKLKSRHAGRSQRSSGNLGSRMSRILGAPDFQSAISQFLTVSPVPRPISSPVQWRKPLSDLGDSSDEASCR